MSRRAASGRPSSLEPGRPGDGYQYIDHPLAVGEGGVWLLRAPQLIHIDPLNAEVRSDTIDVGIGFSQSVATGFDAVWVISGDGLFRVHPGTDEVESVLISSSQARSSASPSAGTSGWARRRDIFRIDPSTGTRAQADTGLPVDKIAVTSSALWIANTVHDELTQVDLESLEKTGDPIRSLGAWIRSSAYRTAYGSSTRRRAPSRGSPPSREQRAARRVWATIPPTSRLGSALCGLVIEVVPSTGWTH